MAYGDINIQTLTIGGMNLNSGNPGLYMASMDLYEDILNPLGPIGEIKVVDAIDALGSVNLNGKEEAQISFTGDDSFGFGSKNFKFKLLQNSNLDDNSQTNYGSSHNKQYTLKLVRPELINAQGNYVKKSFNKNTSDMVKDIVKENLNSDLDVDIQDSTKGQRRLVFNEEHPVEAIRKLNNEHVSAQNESSLYTLFVTDDNGQQKYVFTTYEQLFSQAPVVKLNQTTTLGAGSTEIEKQNSMIWFKASDSFFTPTRPLDKPSGSEYNLTTGKVYRDKKPVGNFKFADAQGVYSNYNGTGNEEVPVRTINDPVNNKNQNTYLSDARKKRAAFFSHLSQNAAELEIPGNPNIKLGSMIELNIPGKTDPAYSTLGEKQMNGRALVVAIRHKVKPLGQSPRYTMILRVVKASYKEGGGGNG